MDGPSVATAMIGDVAPPGYQNRHLVGRDAELAEITSLLGVRPARKQDLAMPNAVLLSGDAGVGKTRLLTELRDVAFAEGWQVFAGHCLDFGDSALPYLPFSEVMGRLAADLPDVVTAVADAYPVLGRLQPGRRMMSDGGEGRDESQGSALDRGDLFDAVHAVFEAVSEKAPVLLVIEDAHWADQSTRDMLSFLFSRPFLGPVGIVASYRSDDLHRRHPLRSQVAEWSRVRGVDRLQLDPLSPAHVRTLVHQLHPEPIGDADVSDIVDRAEGNAFFVEELVGAASGPGRWVPADLADLLLVRLDRLDDTARQVVRAASVAGRRVTHGLLAAASGVEPGVLEGALRKAVEMNVLVAQGSRYSFRHALLGEATYDDLLPGERVRLHARFADALREGHGLGTAAELARHARLAMDYDTAIDASIRAGDEAMSVGGPDEAAQHYQQALEMLADPRRVPDPEFDLSKLVANAADALTTSGHPGRAAALVQEHLGRLPADAPDAWRARLLAMRASALISIESEQDPTELSAEAVRLLPPDASKLRAKVLAIHARILSSMGRFDQAQVAGLEALALAEKFQLSALASDAITTLSGLKRAGPVEGLREALVDAVARAEETGAVQAELRGRFLLGRSYQDWADFDQAEKWFRSGLERGVEAGIPWAPFSFDARWNLAWLLDARGQWDDALVLLDVTGQSAPALVKGSLTALRLPIESARGRDVTAELASLRRHWPLEGLVAIYGAALGIERAGHRGDAAAAVASYRDGVEVLTGIWHEWFVARIRLATMTLGAIADAMPTLSADEQASYVPVGERLHADGHTVLQRRKDPSGFWGPEGQAWVKRLDAEMLRLRWLAGVDAPPSEVLVQAWSETVLLFDEFGHVYWTAVARTVLSGVLRATGDAAGAREQGDQAREVAHQLGATVLLDQLKAIGITPTRGQAGSATLTPREHEILALVAQGRSNGEVGKQLFISTKTVSVHVSNILGKLGASGRTEAAAIARRQGLLD